MRPDDLDPADAFVPLDPPPDGWRALRARLDRDRPRPRRAGLLTVATLALTLVVVFISRRLDRPSAGRLLDAAPEHYLDLAALGLAAAPAEPVTALAAPGAPPVRLRRVPVDAPGVVFYLAGRGIDQR